MKLTGRRASAWAESVVFGVVLSASGAVHSADAEPQRVPVALPRCWYVVHETVVPVNLAAVAIAVTVAPDPALRIVTFARIALPGTVVTEITVSPARAQELIDEVARRREECAAGLQSQ
ncbi:MAG TPA: hypothetical protein VF169_04530 [Albitalea sp.]|uniref:hypothetical protein n=1 Tax=Piscinibacter sp. TaxID=1903157 RepID=UPI002ED2A5DF